MAQQVVIAGALFNDVPSISVPDSNSVYHPFVDPSITTATESDVAQGKIFVKSDGSTGTGTASGGGGGGLEYETGTWTPTNDIARGEIAFTNTHDNPPCLLAIYDSSSPSTLGKYSNLTELFFDPYRLNGDGFPYDSTSVSYAIAQYTYTGSSVSTSGQRQVFFYRSSSTTDSSSSYVRYWIKPDRFYPYTNSTSRYWRAGRTYKWIAVWTPTS